MFDMFELTAPVTLGSAWLTVAVAKRIIKSIKREQGIIPVPCQKETGNQQDMRPNMR
jgi:hypothetical protein